MSDTSKLLYDGFHKIAEVKTISNGREVTSERLVLLDGVGALVVDTNKRIALVTQYRPTVGLTTKEIPAGVMDKGISKVETLFEELEEECHITQRDVLYFDDAPFREYFMVMGSSDAKMHLYEVHVEEQEDKEIKDDNDVVGVEWVTLDEFTEYVEKGLIVDSKTLLAYEYAKRILDVNYR